MLEELGISLGTAIVLLIALYYVVKNAVKNGMRQAWKDITGEKTAEEVWWEKHYAGDGEESDLGESESKTESPNMQ